MAGFDVIRKQLEEERRRNAAPTPTQPAPTVQAPAAAPSANVTQKAVNPIDPFNIRYAGPKPEPEKMPEWETARQNPALLNSIKRYAKNVAGENFADDQAAFDWYVGDRRWKDANVGSMIKELNFVKGGFGVKEPTIQDLEDLQVMRTEWDKLPGGFERIAKGDVLGGTGAILENVAKGMLDPTILLGGIFGKAAGTLVAKQGMKEVTKQGIKRALQTGTAITTDFGIGAGASTIYQETNVELGLQNEVSGWEALKAGGLGALLSTPGAIGAFSPKKAAEVVDPELAAQQAISGASELRKRGIRSFSEGSGKTPDGLKLTQDDVELVQTGKVEAKGISEEELKQASDFLQNDIRFAQVLREALPHLESPGDFFKFVGQNAPKLREWKLRNTNSIVDEGDFPRMLRSMQQEFEDQFQTARRGVVSDKQTMREVKNLAKGKTPEQMVQEVTTPIPGYVGNASEQTYRRMVIAMMEDDLTQAADNILKLGRDLTEDEIRDFERKHELMGAALANFGGMRSETGRALRVSPLNRTEQLMGKVASTANKLVGTDLSTQERSRLLTDIAKGMKMLDKGDDLQLELFVANLNSGPGTLSEKFYEMWYNWGLLSNPSTVVVNSLGGMASGGLNIAEKAVGAAFHSSERAPFVSRLAGYFTSIPEALKVGFKTYASEVPIDTQTRLENSRSYALTSWKLTDKGWRKAGVGESGLIIGGKQARIPGRMLMATDDMLKFSHQRAYIHSEAMRASVQAGKAGDAKFLKDYYANVPPEVLNAAEEEARRLTYTDRLGSTMRNFQQFVHDLPGGRLIFPFIRTPTKIIQQAADMLSVPGTPFTTSRTAADLAAGGVRKTEALARVGIGYSLLGTGAWMAANGLMTGAAPKDEGARRTFELNRLPWSVKLDNTWVQFNRFDPVAIPLTIGVGLEKTFEAFAASGTGLEREDAFMTTMTAMLSDALLDKSFFQGVENVVTAITEPERKLQSFGKGVVRSFVPAVTAGFARAVDPRTTAPVTFWEVIQDRIGFDAREKVPTAVNALGYEVPNEVYGSTEGDTGVIHTINRWIQPFRARSGADDPLLNELYDLGVSLNPRRKKWKNVELDSRQQHAYAKAEGRTLRDTLRFVTSQPGWKSMPKETKRLFIEKAKDSAAKMGQMMMLATYPELYKQDMQANRTVEKLIAPTREQVKEKIAPKNILDIFKKSDIQ